MRLIAPTPAGEPPPASVVAARDAVPDEAALRAIVTAIAEPRHNLRQPQANRRVADWLAARLGALGLAPEVVGDSRTVLARGAGQRPRLLIGAHYDSVPGSPGADDNASACAAALGAAQALRQAAPELPVAFAFFNCEEDGLLGSREFVRLLPELALPLRGVHVLEMVGYRDARSGAQSLPPLPIAAPDTGDFVALIANHRSAALLAEAIAAAGWSALPALGLQLHDGMEHLLPLFKRSDHASFWAAGLPALMWTDTAEFRNPHYHQASDTPETLDYAFLREVTQLLVGAVVSGSSEAG